MSQTISTLGQVWEKMQIIQFPFLEVSTQRTMVRRWKLLSDLGAVPMNLITPSVVNKWILEKKDWFLSEEYLKLKRGKASRCNLRGELALLKTIFKWYQSEEIYENEIKTIINPVLPKHLTIAFIRPVPTTAEDKKITLAQAFIFFQYLHPLYRDLAMVQFFCAGRIGEIAGLQISNVNLNEEYLIIKESAVWCNQNKVFEYLKPFPKNRETRKVYLHSWLKEILIRRIKYAPSNCNFVFHYKGQPLNYCTIQRHYNLAQKKAGLSISGTHCLRHGMATLARQVGGFGLDSVMAMTGHKNIKLADHYSRRSLDLQRATSIRIVEHIKEAGFGIRTSV